MQHICRKLFVYAAALAVLTTPFLTHASVIYGDITNITNDGVDGYTETTWGGTGIPTNQSAYTLINDSIVLGLSITQRFSSPVVTWDGVGNYTALSGESAPGLATWNFNVYAGTNLLNSDLADAGLRSLTLSYQIDGRSGTQAGLLDLSGFLGLPTIQGSENLGFGYLTGIVDGVTDPTALQNYSSDFNPFALGAYDFVLAYTYEDGNNILVGDSFSVSVNVVNSVPAPASVFLLFIGAAVIALRKRM